VAADLTPIRPRTTSDGQLLRFSEVTAGFGERTLFTALDLDLEAGHWLVVTGPSGSGKSTLLALAAGLLDPWSGVVSVAGSPWAGRDRAARAGHRRSWLSLAPQRASLVEPLTVEENLRLSAEVRGGASTGLAAVVESLALTRLTGQPVHTLSGGERQRVALARCLMTAAPVLVLDEPTSQQDDASADLVVAALRSETGRGRAVLVATHDPRLIAVASEDGAELQLGPGPPRLVQAARATSRA
jgi:heme ABC exporter ATP-binding subunit CcmA